MNGHPASIQQSPFWQYDSSETVPKSESNLQQNVNSEIFINLTRDQLLSLTVRMDRNMQDDSHQMTENSISLKFMEIQCEIETTAQSDTTTEY